ncbi:hypothetical protein RRG08_029495 [Elysia crispata]|uniref:Uncharacterized protein n=1 Tax=Elysia crispata TaxID=231223 RepID=A0AAE0ZX44_9GAST|nr:hypothetical protein RRG08_029495 [Elysia crispata]
MKVVSRVRTSVQLLPGSQNCTPNAECSGKTRKTILYLPAAQGKPGRNWRGLAQHTGNMLTSSGRKGGKKKKGTPGSVLLIRYITIMTYHGRQDLLDLVSEHSKMERKRSWSWIIMRLSILTDPGRFRPPVQEDYFSCWPS